MARSDAMRLAFGAVPDAVEGDHFVDRRDLYEAGIHRPTQAGIAGREAEGAESIVLSGGYEDDEDYGDLIIYTGQGGRDPATGKQIADQEFTGQNQALRRNW